MKKTLIMSLLLLSYGASAQIAIPSGYTRKHYKDPTDEHSMSTVTNGRITISFLALGRGIMAEDSLGEQTEALAMVFESRSYTHVNSINYSNSAILDNGKYYYSIYKDNSLMQVTVSSPTNDAAFTSMCRNIRDAVKDTKELTWVASTAKATNQTSAANKSTSGSKTLDSLDVLGIRLIKGMQVIINNPLHKPGGSPWTYENIFQNFVPSNPRQSSVLGGTKKVFGVIQNFFNDPIYNEPYAVITVGGTNIILYVNIEKALLAHEIEVSGVPLKFALYQVYLSGLKSITDKDAINFINSFTPPNRELNEFERKELMDAYTTELEKLIGVDFTKFEQVYFGVAGIGEYDFQRHGFPVRQGIFSDKYGMIGFATSPSFSMTFGDKFKAGGIEFSGIDGEMFIPIEVEKAKKIIGSIGDDRLIYYKYYFNFNPTTKSGIGRTGSGTDARACMSFIVTAKINEIEIFADAHLKHKLTSFKP